MIHSQGKILINHYNSKQMQNNQAKIFDSQVSGKLPKYTNNSRSLIYKKLSKTEHKFYQTIKSTPISSMDVSLEKFLPQFLGVQNISTQNADQEVENSAEELRDWVKHISQRQIQHQGDNNLYLVLGNLTAGYEAPCLMDIKLGKKLHKIKKSNSKFKDSTTNSHNFRINGMKGYHATSKTDYFINKYYFQKTTEPQIELHLAYFFYDGHTIDTALLQKCVEVIKQLILSLLSFKAGFFHSSSLLICYDGNDHSSFQVKLIDFDSYHPNDRHEADLNIIEGLKYLVGYFLNILGRSEEHSEKIRRKQMKVFMEKSEIPGLKVDQLQKKEPSSPVLEQALLEQ